MVKVSFFPLPAVVKIVALFTTVMEITLAKFTVLECTQVIGQVPSTMIRRMRGTSVSLRNHFIELEKNDMKGLQYGLFALRIIKMRSFTPKIRR